MQIVGLELQHSNFYCPATGERILMEDDCNEDAKSLQAYWVDLFFEDPIIKNKKLAAAWKKFLKKNQGRYGDCFEMLEDFLRDYPEPNWVVFKLSEGGVGCSGPMSSTAWHVLDLNVQ